MKLESWLINFKILDYSRKVDLALFRIFIHTARLNYNMTQFNYILNKEYHTIYRSKAWEATFF